MTKHSEKLHEQQPKNLTNDSIIQQLNGKINTTIGALISLVRSTQKTRQEVGDSSLQPKMEVKKMRMCVNQKKMLSVDEI